MGNRIGRSMAAAVAMAFAPAAMALDFETDDGVKINWNTTISVGTSIRAEKPDPKLVHPNNAALYGISDTVGGNTDDSTLNFEKGKSFSSPFKMVTDVEVKKGSFGGLVRAKAWYDYTLEQRGVRHGSFSNGYVPGAKLDDSNYEDLAKFSGVALLDAYVYGTFKMGEQIDTQARLGRHVLNWGESLFIQGVNQINPIDVAALRRPGTEVKEVLLPVGMVSANMGLGKGISAEGFYQWEWKNTVVDGCGTYFLTADASVGRNAQNACAGGFQQSLTPAQATQLSALLHRPIASGDQGGFGAGAYVPLTAGRDASNSGQFGLSLRFPVNAIDTEFGLYGMNIHSRVPYLSAVKGNSPFPLTTALLGAAASQQSAFWEYPEDIRLYGVSASTLLGGISVGAELSYSPNFPVQAAAGDMVAGLVYGSAPAALGVLGITPAVAALMNANRGPLMERFVAAPNGGYVQGWDRFNKTQFQVNGIVTGADVLGAGSYSLAGEVGMQSVNVPDSTTGVRYGRGFVFGVGTHPSFGPLAGAVPGGCPILNTPNQPGCENDGFVTDFSWGYRLRGQLVYSNVFNFGFTAKPSLFWAHDVKGVSADGQFNEGRKTLGLGLGFEYQKRYNFDLGYVMYSNSAKWDPLRDRDYYSAAISVTF